ncbi:MAG TPA: alpha/beta hydrolase [Actinomycetota bacterium]|nr:alpha/beta hydrolase [Actinomycetota bacterium]
MGAVRTTFARVAAVAAFLLSACSATVPDRTSTSTPTPTITGAPSPTASVAVTGGASSPAASTPSTSGTTAPTSGPAPFETPSDDSLIANSTAITFPSADGARLAGRLFGEGTTGVVLSHMLDSDQEPWWWMASVLADHGFVALTYDSSGTCPGGPEGCSHGRLDPGSVQRNILGAAAYLRAHGAKRVVIGGASLGGTASLWVASKHPDAVDGVFTLSAVPFFPPYDITARVIHAISDPKLFVAGANDPSAGPYVPGWKRAATPPVRALVLETATHGTDLFGDEDFSATVRSEILRFVQGVAS